jgi:putative transposase
VQIDHTPVDVIVSTSGELVAEHGAPVTVTNETAFLVDFLPVIRWTLSRTGFQIDRSTTATRSSRGSSAGNGWESSCCAATRATISRFWALDPDSTAYLEVPQPDTTH